MIVLLKKGDKPEGEPSSCPPLCLLNDVGKIFEHLLSRRLEHIVTKGASLQISLVSEEVFPLVVRLAKHPSYSK